MAASNELEGGATKAKAKSTPVYDHVLRDPYFRKEVYEPEADTFLMLDAIDLIATEIIGMAAANGPLEVVEFGCGSGVALTHAAMLLAASGRPHHFTAVDINPRALEATRLTFSASLSDTQRKVCTLDLIRADLMTAFSPRAKFDLLIFNPPYVPTTVEELNEAVVTAARNTSWICAAWAGGPRGRLVVDRVLPVLHWLLRQQTGIALVIALKENDIPDMIRFVEAESNGVLSGTIAVSRWTGENLNVVKFFFRTEAGRVELVAD
jgi:release factor glutamine methyltransferase